MKHAILFLSLALLLCGAGCLSVATEEDLERVAADIRKVEEAVIDAIPLPLPKDATKEMVGWISDLLILGGGAGAVGVGGKKVMNRINGKKGKAK